MTQPNQTRRARHRERTHRDRAGDRCPRCGRPYEHADRVDVHHRDERTGNGSPDNLRKRCKKCHLTNEHDRDTDSPHPGQPSRSRPGRRRTSPR